MIRVTISTITDRGILPGYYRQFCEPSEALNAAPAPDLDAENDRLRAALEKCANLIDDYYFEGDKEYQVVILARAALERP